MAATSLKLVLNGFALSNPFVGQGAYTLRLVQGLEGSLRDEFLVVLPHNANIPVGLGKAKFLHLPRRFVPSHELFRQIVYNHQLLRFVCEEFPYAVFHSPGPIASRHIPRRAVVTLHDCIYRSFPNYLGRFFIRRVYMRATERFAAKASLVLTDSVFSRDQLISKVGIEPYRIKVLHPWVGNEFLSPAPPPKVETLRTRLKLPNHFWLYLGGYDYRKNVEFLIESYATAQRSRPLPPLVLAGNILQKRTAVTCDVLGALQKSGLSSDNVLMPGLIPSDDLPDLYRAAALLIYPSLMEGFGLPPAEAMATGTPVLASNKSSLPEVVQRAECLFDPTNHESLVEKLIAAAQDETQFSAKLSPTFVESHAINRYLKLIDQTAKMTDNE